MESRQSLSAAALQLMNAGRLEEAREAASRAVDGLDVCSPAHGLLAMILLQMDQRAEAESVISQATALPSGVADAYDALAFVSLQLGLYERSNGLYRRAAEVAPGEARFWYNLATSERSFGRLTDAENACQRAIEVNKASYQSYLLRSELCVQSVASNHVEELLKLANDPQLDDRGRGRRVHAAPFSASLRSLRPIGRLISTSRPAEVAANLPSLHAGVVILSEDRETLDAGQDGKRSDVAGRPERPCGFEPELLVQLSSPSPMRRPCVTASSASNLIGELAAAPRNFGFPTLCPSGVRRRHETTTISSLSMLRMAGIIAWTRIRGSPSRSRHASEG